MRLIKAGLSAKVLTLIRTGIVESLFGHVPVILIASLYPSNLITWSFCMLVELKITD